MAGKYSRGSRSAGSVAARRASAATVIQRKQRSKKISNLRLNPTVAKLVDRRIAKREETCEIFKKSDAMGNYLDQNGPIDAGDWHYLVPEIFVGDERDMRSGAKIKLVSFTVSGYLHFIPSDTQGQYDNLFARVIVATGKGKAYQNGTDMAAKLLRDGSDAVNYNGTVTRHWLPINTPDILVHGDKKFKLISNRFVQYETLNPADLTTTRYGVTRVIKIVPFKFSLKVKSKILRYNETDNYPENFAPYIAFGVCNGNNPNQGMDQTGHVKMLCSVHMKWKNM